MHIDDKARLGGLFHAFTLFSHHPAQSKASSVKYLARRPQLAFLCLLGFPHHHEETP
ncbi:hypothetical protein [Pseudomonas putida]|uniref:hypothetical protein n=1 Tax=Pseudomonas putida TaxID=303 RepID=UPI00160372C1|nr:hypothetical protein [Pseudomonas putida]